MRSLLPVGREKLCLNVGYKWSYFQGKNPRNLGSTNVFVKGIEITSKLEDT